MTLTEHEIKSLSKLFTSDFELFKTILSGHELSSRLAYLIFYHMLHDKVREFIENDLDDYYKERMPNTVAYLPGLKDDRFRMLIDIEILNDPWYGFDIIVKHGDESLTCKCVYEKRNNYLRILKHHALIESSAYLGYMRKYEAEEGMLYFLKTFL